MAIVSPISNNRVTTDAQRNHSVRACPRTAKDGLRINANGMTSDRGDVTSMINQLGGGFSGGGDGACCISPGFLGAASSTFPPPQPDTHTPITVVATRRILVEFDCHGCLLNIFVTSAERPFPRIGLAWKSMTEFPSTRLRHIRRTSPTSKSMCLD